MKKIFSVGIILFSINSFASHLTYNPTQAAQFEKTNQCQNCDLTGYETLPKRVRRNVNLTHTNLSGYATIGHDGENWQGANFSFAAIAHETQLAGDFSGSDFHQATITDFSDIATQLSGNFDNVNFSSIKMIRGSIYNSSCNNSNFTGAIIQFSSIDCGFMNSKFNNATLSNVRFSSSHSPGADFSNAKVTNSNFHHVGLASSLFKNAVLTSTQFYETNLTNADFTGADVTAVAFYNANLCGAKITQEQLDKVGSLNCSVKPDCSGYFPSDDGSSCPHN